MSPKQTLTALQAAAPSEMAALERALKSPAKPEYCEDCGGTGICGDEGPGKRNAVNEWLPCECPLGRAHRSIPESWPEWKAERERMSARILVLEDALNEIYHATDSTSHQMEIISNVLPQSA